MTEEEEIERLLKWSLEQAEADAPPPPRGTQLLEMARPWWEVWPEQFQRLSERLGRMHVAYGHAMMSPEVGRGGHRVAAVVVGTGRDLDCTAQVLHLGLKNGRLTFRFQLDAPVGNVGSAVEVTFVSTNSSLVLFSASAVLSLNSEYSVIVTLPGDLAKQWKALTVTTAMPFSLILRAGSEHCEAFPRITQ